MINRKYQSSIANKLIATLIINQNIHQLFTAKLTFSQERRPIGLGASDGLTNIYKDGLTKYKKHK